MEIVKTNRKGDTVAQGETTSVISHRLLDAVYDNDITLARQLIEAGADVNYTSGYAVYTNEPCLIAAIRVENLEMVELLLHHGANPNTCTDAGDCALRYAIQQANLLGKVGFVQVLLNYGADVKWPSGMDGNTPLMDAIRNEQNIVLQLLISRGADPYVKNYSGENLFAYAKRRHYLLPPELVEEPQRSLLHVMGIAIKKRFGQK